MKNYLTAFLIILCFKISAQTSTLFEDNYSNAKSCISIDGDYVISSTSITTKFQNTFIRGTFLDVATKDGSLSKMKNENRLGSEVNAGISYWHKRDKFLGIDSTSFFIGFRERTFFNTKFPPDLFRLYFYGNKPFAGRAADVSNFDYRGIKYQQLQFGIFKELTKAGGTFSYAVSVSALNGQDFLKIKTTHGSLFTQQDAEYVDMSLHLEASQSDTSHSKFGNSNGLGASGSVEFEYAVKNKYRICFSASDIGFIKWNSKSISFVVDTSYHFEGVVVNNLLDTLYLDLKSEQDFKDGFKKDKKSKSFSTALPYRFNLSYERTLIPQKITAAVGAEYILNSDYDPLIYFSSDYIFNTRTHAGITFQYGGYSGFHVGIQASRDFGHGYIVSIGSVFFDGYLVTSSSTAQGAYAKISKIF